MKRRERDSRREILGDISRSVTAKADAYLLSPERKRDAETLEQLFDLLLSKRQNVEQRPKTHRSAQVIPFRSRERAGGDE
jgi:hypothetical protein